MGHSVESNAFTAINSKPTLDTLVFTYNVKVGVIFVNGRYLTKNVSALILRKMLKAFISERKKVFERKEFIYDPEITYDQNNPCFSVRMQRLENALRKNCPQITIVKHERGKLLLKTACAIDYREE